LKLSISSAESLTGCLSSLFKRVGKILDDLQYTRQNVILIWKEVWDRHARNA
jgi:hypothetical protein